MKLPSLLYSLLIALCIKQAATAANPPRLMIETQGPAAKVQQLIFSPNGKKLISLGNDKAIRIWETTSGQLLQTLRGQTGDGADGMIYAGAISPDGKWLAVGGYFDKLGTKDIAIGDIRIIDLDRNEIIAVLKGHGDVIGCLKFSKDGSTLASGSGDGELRVWDCRQISANTNSNDLFAMQILKKHSSWLKDLSFSPDGLSLVSASADQTMILWRRNYLAGRFSAANTMAKHTSSVKEVGYSPNGQFIISAGADGQLLLWGGRDGNFMGALESSKYIARSAGFSPDSKRVIASFGSKTTIFEPATGSKKDATVHNSTVTAMAWHPSGNLVATSGGTDNRICIWNPDDESKRTYLESNGSTGWSVAFANEGLKVAFGQTYDLKLPYGEDRLEKIFDFESLQLRDFDPARDSKNFRRTINKQNGIDLKRVDSGTIKVGEQDIKIGGTGGMWSCSFSPGTKQVIIGTRFALRSILPKGEKYEHKTEFVGHFGSVNAVSPSQDGRYLASTSSDQTVKLWDLQSGKLLATLYLADNGEWVCWSPNGFYHTSYEGEKLFGWHVNQGPNRLAKSFPSSSYKTFYQKTESLKQIITGNRRLSAPPSTTVAQPPTPAVNAAVSHLTFTPDGRTMISMRDKNIQFWEAQTGKLKGTLLSQNPSPMAGSISPDGRWLAASGYLSGAGGDSAVIDTTTGKVVAKLNNEFATSFDFSKDGRLLVSGGNSGTLRIWDSSTIATLANRTTLASLTGLQELTGHQAKITSVGFSPDRLRLVSTSEDTIMILWQFNASAGRYDSLTTLKGHTKAGLTAKFSPNGQYIISGGADGQILVWNGLTGALYGALEITKDKIVKSLTFSPNGKRLVASVGNNTSLYNLDTWKKDNTFLNSYATAAAWNPLSNMVATSGGINNNLSFWNLEGGISTAIPTVTTVNNPKTPVPPAAVPPELAPKIGWEYPGSPEGENSKKSEAAIKARISSLYSSLEAVTLFHNGKPVKTKQNIKGNNMVVFEQYASLIPGVNRFKLVAKNGKTTATSEERVVTYTPDSTAKTIFTENRMKPNLYMLSIGVSDFADDSLTDLNYCDDDAIAITNVFRKQAGGIFGRVETKVLIDKTATESAIQDGLDWINRNATQKDFVVLFLSAHGGNDNLGNFYFIAHDTDTDRLRSTGVAWKDFGQVLGNLPSRVLMILDTCHSGQLGTNLLSMNNGQFNVKSSANQAEAIAELASDENGVVIMSASTGNEISVESGKWGHGAFTKGLLEGLEGKADFNKDGIIHLRELDFFVSDYVKVLTDGKQHPTTVKPSSISRLPIAAVLP